MLAVKSSFNQINAPLSLVTRPVTTPASPRRCHPCSSLDGLRVGEVVQGVAALAVDPRAWAEVGGQPVPQLIRGSSRWIPASQRASQDTSQLGNYKA